MLLDRQARSRIQLAKRLGGLSNKRIQRMAYALSNKEVVQSTADAPNVRHNTGHLEETDADSCGPEVRE